MSSLRPLTVIAVIIMVVNDHILKHAWPGFITGKLSDIVGMIYFPCLLHILLWILLSKKVAPTPTRLDNSLLFVCFVTAIVFSLTKTTAFGNEAYRVAWGAMQWPWSAFRAALRGATIPGLARVGLVRDPTDLLAVPFAALAFASGRTPPAPTPTGATALEANTAGS